MKRKQGFTIPELLAVIVIIGILAVMATGSYITISNQVKAKTLKTKLDYINEKAIDYANDYSIEDTTITVAKLISEGYLDMENVTDDNTKINNPEGGYLDCYKIKITRESDNYNSEITPSDDCSLANNDILASNLDVGVYAINKLGTNLVSNNKTNWTNSDVVLYVNPNYLRNNGLLDKVVSITWVFNGDSTVKNSKKMSWLAVNDITYDNIFRVESLLLLNSRVMVKIETTTTTLVKYVDVKIDKENPTLEMSVSNDYVNGNTNKKKIIFAGNDGSGSGFSGKSYYLTTNPNKRPSASEFDIESTKEVGENTTYYGYAKDAVGNISTTPAVIEVSNIDYTGPVCYEPVSNPGWSQSYTYYYGCRSDVGSGCSTPIQSKTITKDTVSVTEKWSITDNVNNSNNCETTFNANVDVTPPTCSITVDPSSVMGKNNWYTSDVKLNISVADNLSGVKRYGITTSASEEYNGNSSATLTYDTDGITYYGYVEDNAGNKGKCSIKVKRLATPPTCTISKNGTYGKNGWFISNVNIAIKASGRHISSEKITSSSGATYGNSYILSRDTAGESVSGIIENEAGLTGSCSTTVKRDASKPIASLGMQVTRCNYDVHYETDQKKSDCDGGGYKTGTKSIACSTYENNGYSDRNRLNAYMRNNVSHFDSVLSVSQDIQYSTRVTELKCSDAVSGVASYSIGGKSGSTLDIYDASPEYYTLSGTCTDKAGNQTTVSTTFYRYDEEEECESSRDYFSKTDCGGGNSCADKTGDCSTGTEEKCHYTSCNEGSSKCDNPDSQTETDTYTCGENKWRVA